MPSLLLSNPLGADDAQRIGLEIRYHQVGEVITVNDYVFAALLRTGYGIPYGTAEETLLVGDGSPTEATGVDGQWYLDRLNEVLWGPKVGGEWPDDPIRPDRGVQSLRIENYRLIVTYSTGTEIDLGDVRGPAGPAPSPATTAAQGVLRLAGDLAGTADNPTVPGLASRVPTSEKGAANGVATLGSGGKVPVGQLPAGTASGVASLGADSKVPIGQLPAGTASGVASLDAGGKIPSAQLPAIAITNTFPVDNQAAMLALDVQVGDVAIRADGTGTFILRQEPSSVLANWSQLAAPTDAVQSVAGKTGAVNLASADISDATDAATPNMLAKRDSAGRLKVANPAATSDAATKFYVDSTAASTRRIAVRSLTAAYTFALADDGMLVALTGANARTFTVPANATVALPISAWIDVQQQGTGALTIAGAAGVTIYNPVTGAAGPVTLPGQYARVRLHQIAANVWVVNGDLGGQGAWTNIDSDLGYSWNLPTAFAAAPASANGPMSASVTVPAGRTLDVEVTIPRVVLPPTTGVQLRLVVGGVQRDIADFSTGSGVTLYQPVKLSGSADGTGGALAVALEGKYSVAQAIVNTAGGAGPVRIRYKIT